MFLAAEVDVLQGCIKASVAGVRGDFMKFQAAPRQICKPQMAERVGCKVRQGGPQSHRPHNLVPHLEGEGFTEIAARFGNEQGMIPRRTASAHHRVAVFDVRR